MKSKYLMFIFAIAVLGTSHTVCAVESNDLIQTMEWGSINWSKGVIQATGEMAPNKQIWGDLYQKERVFMMALSDAYRNLLEKVLTIAMRAGYQNLLKVSQSVRIDSDRLVKDILANNDTIMAEIESMIKSAEIVKKEYLSDGTVRVTLQMSLYGGFSQLVLPRDIQVLENVRIVNKHPSNPKINASAETSTDHNFDSKHFTGVVVDARGLSANPAMMPIILDENGDEVFGPPFISREYAVQRGISGYTTAIETATGMQRVAGNPIKVKGIRTQGDGRAIIVISNSDASKIRASSIHLALFKQCRVVIVID